ncbi:fibronectin type III domain-containing protein [Bifidobacterium aerophilum]|uniref:AAA family ATPase n=1 Tax=Bifidobacterium aerophilum TaxID=1798155 RepID=A0A6N9Z2L3_9BIFI|nr:fibronectin type III domain-containing protein [Bifidobacterium aerophilum]NEG88455.1 AAA family ATPase [Bifidobacterium aerophilum]
MNRNIPLLSKHPTRHKKRTTNGKTAHGSQTHRIATVLTALALVAVIVGAVYSVSAARRMVHLDDGTVWVTSSSGRTAARLNVRAGEIDASVPVGTARFDVVQHDDVTVLVEDGTVTSLGASTAQAKAQAIFPANVRASLGSDVVALLDPKNGGVRIMRVDDLNAADQSSRPCMELGSGGLMTVDHTGTVYGYRPHDGMVLSSDVSCSVSRLGSLSGGARLDADDFTVVSGVPVVAAQGVIRWREGSADTGSDRRLTLQDPDVNGDQGSWVAASDDTGLFLIKLDSEDREATPTVLRTTGGGEPARPVSVGGCVYAAWSQRAFNYRRVCGSDGRDADGTPGVFQSLDAVSASGDLRFRTNHRLVVLNDVTTGTLWDPDTAMEALDVPWHAPSAENGDDRHEGESTAIAGKRREYAESCTQDSGSLRAVDDRLGIRAGFSGLLDVLGNDEQADCAVLRISRVGAPSGADISVSTVHDGRYLQIDAQRVSVSDRDTVEARFTYEVDDGRGRVSTAQVVMEVVGSDGNRAPRQIGTPMQYDVEQGTLADLNALESFLDPDGDPLTLLAATIPDTRDDGTQVGVRTDGLVEFIAGPTAQGRVGVELTVYDGVAIGTGTIYCSVHPPGTLPARVDPVTVTASPGTPAVVDLKPYVHVTSTATTVLDDVQTAEGMTVDRDEDGLSFTVTADEPGTYYLPFTLMQGTVSTGGLVRVDVHSATERHAPPITVNDVALLGEDGSAVVDPLDNDVDPMAGALGLIAVEPDTESGIDAIVVAGRVHLSATRIPASSVTVRYVAANAAGTAYGSITVQPPAPATAHMIVAEDITLRVRTGGITSTDIRDHVRHATGSIIMLDNGLQYEATSFDGLIFVSGNTIRYQAADHPGSYEARYTVRDDSGNVADGVIRLEVHQADARNKPAPLPRSVQAQATAGRMVRIDIPLSGIDVDGDDVMLLGLGDQVPRLGRIVEVGAEHLTYEAYPDSSGTDSFSYAVEDWSGRRAQASVRVAVCQGDSGFGVMARDDTVTLRPNVNAAVAVADNDLSSDGSALSLEAVADVQGLSAVEVEHDMLSFVTPSEPGTYHAAYTVRHETGLADTATLSVRVDAQAPIRAPTARDYRVPPSDTVDKRSVEVDVSAWIGNPSGTVEELVVDVDPSAASHARRRGDAGSTIVSIDLTPSARAIPYTVTNVTHGIAVTAFIHVPAYGVFAPTLRPQAPTLTVNDGESLTIRLAEHVRVGPGKTAYVTAPDTVSATKASEGSPYVDAQTLRFVPQTGYSGPASITFSVSDVPPAESGTGRIVNTAVLTLRITVIGGDAPPPTFLSTTVDVAAGEPAVSLDLTMLTRTPTGADGAARTYRYSSAGDEAGMLDVSVSEDGRLTVGAPDDTKPGTIRVIPVSIMHERGTVDGSITVRVSASSRPLAKIVGRTLTLRAGSRESTNVLEGAYDPFPDVGLSVAACTVEGSDAIDVTECAGNGMVTVSAAEGSGAVSGTVRVTVKDATDTVDRQVVTSIAVTVIDRPSAPLMLPSDARASNASAELSWVSGAANGSPIIEYAVEWGDGSQSCGMATVCLIDGLANGRVHTFVVRARNDVGWSDASASVSVMPDTVPTQPTGITVEAGYRTVTVRWQEPSYAGSRPQRYTVTLSDTAGGHRDTKTVDATQATFAVAHETVLDGVGFRATVTAHNQAGAGVSGTSGDDALVWSDPDPPQVDVRQDADTFTVNVTLGNLRNAGCSKIILGGSVSRELRCDEPSASFRLDEIEEGGGPTPKDSSSIRHLWRRLRQSTHEDAPFSDDPDRDEGKGDAAALTITATVHPLKASAAPAGTSITFTPVPEAERHSEPAKPATSLRSPAAYPARRHDG